MLVYILGANLAVAAAKAIYGAASGSLAVSSDALHSLLDASTNVVGLLVMRLAFAPPDEAHPYGHQKIEVLASAAVGVAVGVAAVRFGWGAIAALVANRPAPQATLTGFGVVAGTWVVNLVVAGVEARKARQLKSPLLTADAAHTASDVFVTTAVLASMAGSRLGWAWADPVGALVVFLVIGRVSWIITTKNLTVLLDAAVIETAELTRLVEGHPDVLKCHRVRSRGTVSSVAVDLHIHLEPDMSLARAHEVAHEVEVVLRARFPEIADVVIHMEPEAHGPGPGERPETSAESRPADGATGG